MRKCLENVGRYRSLLSMLDKIHSLRELISSIKYLPKLRAPFSGATPSLSFLQICNNSENDSGCVYYLEKHIGVKKKKKNPDYRNSFCDSNTIETYKFYILIIFSYRYPPTSNEIGCVIAWYLFSYGNVECIQHFFSSFFPL